MRLMRPVSTRRLKPCFVPEGVTSVAPSISKDSVKGLTIAALSEHNSRLEHNFLNKSFTHKGEGKRVRHASGDSGAARRFREDHAGGAQQDRAPGIGIGAARHRADSDGGARQLRQRSAV